MKNKVLVVILIVMVILVSIVEVICFKNDKDNKGIAENDSALKTLSFKDVSTLEYGKYNLSDFIAEDIECNEKCFYLNKEIEYNISDVKSLGKQKVEVKVNYDGSNYAQVYEVEIKDETSPVIDLTADSIEIRVNDQFNPNNYIKSIVDNYDGDLKENVIVENNVDINKEGEYVVTYSITDSNGNTNKKELNVVVKKSDSIETTTKSIVTTNRIVTTKSTSSTINTTKNTTTKKTTTKVTTTKKTTTTKKKTPTFKENVNSIKLNPLKTRYKTIDTHIDKIVAEINKNNSTNYDKLLAAYDYVMNYLSYEMFFLWPTPIYNLMDEYGYNYHDAQQIVLAKYALDDHTGVCDSYAALFMIIARNLGFDAYAVGGQVKSVGGGTTGHAWVTIKINGTYYLFDPQIEDSKNGKQRLVYFGKTEKELNIYTYNRDECVKKFNFFKAYPKASSTVEITGGATTKDTFEFKGYVEKRNQDAISVQKGDVLNIKVSASGVSNYKFKLFYYDGNNSSSRKELASSSSKELVYTINCTEASKMRLEIEVEENVNGRKHTIYYPVNVNE